MRTVIRLLVVALFALCLIVPIHATLLFQDTFTDSDGVELKFHTPTPSGGFTWSQAVSANKIYSNRDDGRDSLSGTISMDTMNAAVSDAVVTGDFVVPTGNVFGCLTGRGSVFTDHWAFCVEDDTGGSQDYVVIYEYTGSSTAVARNSANISSVQSTTHTMTVTFNGNLMRLQFGTGDINYTSSVRNTNQNFGVSSYKDGTYTVIPLDNFTVSTVSGGGGSAPCNLTLLGACGDDFTLQPWQSARHMASRFLSPVR